MKTPESIKQWNKFEFIFKCIKSCVTELHCKTCLNMIYKWHISNGNAYLVSELYDYINVKWKIIKTDNFLKQL